MSKLTSELSQTGTLQFPEYTGTRVMMLPIILGNPDSLPTDVLPKSWHEPIMALGELATQIAPTVANKVAYLTIDESVVLPGLTQRRPGLHTDGYAEFDESGELAYGGWSGGAWAAPPRREPKPEPKPERTPDPWRGGWGGGAWANGYGLGMLTASTHVGCEAYEQVFEGRPGSNGDCAHLVEQLNSQNRVILEPGKIYAMDGDTVHQSLTHAIKTARQFVRLSMPSDAAWYEGYTENSLGILPTGPILPPRPAEFMQWGNQHTH